MSHEQAARSLTFGTRPEAIKMAPVVHECRRQADRIETIVCVTGQHREMLDQVTDYFGIAADRDLDLMAPEPDAGRRDRPLPDGARRRAGRVPARLRRGPGRHDHGDGGRAGRVLSPRAVGPRRGRAADRQPPGPLARGTQPPHRRPGRPRCTAPRPAEAAENLLREGVPPESVHVTGNTVIDALLWTVARERGHGRPWREKYAALGDRRMVLVTGHRRENFGDGMEQICPAILVLAGRFPTSSSSIRCI